MQERCVCNAGNGRREVLAPAINPERGDDLIVFLPNHRFEIGKGWSQPEIPDYFRPSLARQVRWHDRAGCQTAQGSRTGEQPAEKAAGRSPSGYRGTEGGRSGKRV